MPKLASILLVEDDTTTIFLHRLLIERLALTYQLLVAQNGQEALKLLQQSDESQRPSGPELILLDLNMPVMNGHEFMMHYSACARQASPAVVVVLTTSQVSWDLEPLQRWGVAEVLTKPLTSEKLGMLVGRYFPRCTVD